MSDRQPISESEFLSLKEDIVRALGRKKDLFLSQIETKVYHSIRHESVGTCLTLVMRDSEGVPRGLYAPSTYGYLPRLTAFLLKKKYRGLTPDSILTSRVSSAVEKTIDDFYTSDKNGLAEAIAKSLLDDKTFVKAFASLLAERLGTELPTAVRKILTQVIIQHIHSSIGDSISRGASQAVATATTKVVALAASLHVSKIMVAFLVKHLAILLKAVIAKIMASAALKSMIAVAVKKYVGAAVIMYLIKLICAKFGIAHAGMVIGILVPLIAVFTVREFVNLPKNLAKKVSASVRNSFDTEYTRLNNSIVSNIVSFLTSQGLDLLVNQAASDSALTGILKDMVDEAKKGFAPC